jgi:hypothetical protein
MDFLKAGNIGGLYWFGLAGLGSCFIEAPAQNLVKRYQYF